MVFYGLTYIWCTRLLNPTALKTNLFIYYIQSRILCDAFILISNDNNNPVFLHKQ